MRPPRAVSKPRDGSQRGTSPKTTDTPTDTWAATDSTDLPMRHCPTEAKRIRTMALPVLSLLIDSFAAVLSRKRHPTYRWSVVGQGGGPSVPKIVSVD